MSRGPISASSNATRSASSTRSRALRSHLEDVDGAGGQVGADPAPDVQRQAEAGGRHLPLAAAALELPGQLHHLGRAGGPDRVAAREQAAARVDGDAPTQPRHAVPQQPGRLVQLAEADPPALEQLADRGRVVELDHVQVLGTRAASLVGRARPLLEGERLVQLVAPAGYQDRGGDLHAACAAAPEVG
jgi:hypothetical protein